MKCVILHVEDEENDAILFEYAMANAGQGSVSIRVASDGQAAIDYLKGVGKFANRQEFPMPSLVLMDLKLPRIAGLGVLKWIREELGPSIPVVIFSASESEADIAAAYQAGANAYLVKPSDLSKLGEIAKTIKGLLPPRSRPSRPIFSRPKKSRKKVGGRIFAGISGEKTQ